MCIVDLCRTKKQLSFAIDAHTGSSVRPVGWMMVWSSWLCCVRYSSALRFHTKMFPPPSLFSMLSGSVPPMLETITTFLTPASRAASV